LGKDIRADSFRKTCYNALLEGIELSFPRTALKITPITRDVKACQGYVLKETPESLAGIEAHTYTQAELEEFKEYYLKAKASKNVNLDKIRVSNKNLNIVFRNYVKHKNIEIRNSTNVLRALVDMEQDNYYMMPFLHLSTDKLKDLLNYLFHSNGGTLFNYLDDKVNCCI